MAEGQQSGRTLLIQMGSGATPEVYKNFCGVNTRSFNMSANEVDTTMVDCEKPEDTPQKTAQPGIKSRTFTGSGKYVSGASTAAFMQHVIDATMFPAKVIVPGLGSFTGQWFVSDFELSGEMEGTMDFSGTWIAAGKLAFVAEV